MKFLFDLFPVIAFFTTYQLLKSQSAWSALLAPWFGDAVTVERVPLLAATAVTILATALQIGWLKMRHQPVDKTLWVTFFLVSLLGGATLVFHDPRFIQWKPTVLYGLMGVTLWVSRLLGRNLLELTLGRQVQLPSAHWKSLSDAWSLFFFTLAGLNWWVAHHWSEAAWVQFKLFGTLGLTLLFVLAQAWWVQRHAIPEEEKGETR
ncbi:septation protein A [Hydrogenophilus islandicus]